MVLAARAAIAQASVTGTVRDSIARTPLAGATVQLVFAGDPARFARSVLSDSLGRYEFVDVPSGRYMLGFFHPKLDSLGFAAPAREVAVSGSSVVRADLAIPAPARLVQSVCGTAKDSSALVVGVVRDARTRAPVANARVAAEWLELSFTSQGVIRRTPSIVATTGDNGWFALCNVPAGGTIALTAVQGADSTDHIDFIVPADGFAHRELYIGGRAADGRIGGVVLGAADNKPLPGAQITIRAGPQARADDRGEWSISSAPRGTRIVDIRAVGYYPEHRAVDIIDSTPPITVSLSSMKAVLDTVRVNATRVIAREMAGFEARARAGMGSFVSREQIERRNPRHTSDLLLTMNGLHIDRATTDSTSLLVRGGTGWCVPLVFVDGRRFSGLSIDDVDNLVDDPRRIVGVELYAGVTAPAQFQDPLHGCGSIVIWTR